MSLKEEFEVTDEKLNDISKRFKVRKSDVKLLHRLFSDVISGVKSHYLVDIIRSMEAYFRKETNNQSFQIRCEPAQDYPRVLHAGCAFYYPKKLIHIFFPPSMEEKQLRICLARELGHMFLLELDNNKKESGETFLNEKVSREPFSSIFGIFTIMDKNDFYANYARKLNHHSLEEIINDFVHLKGTARGASPDGVK